MTFHALLATAIPLADLVAILLSFLAVVALAYLRSFVGAALALSVAVIGVLAPSGAAVDQGALAQVGGILIYPADAVYGALAIAALFRWLHVASRTRLPVPIAALFIYAAVLVVAFLRGIAPFGIQAAGVGFRNFFFFVAGAAYFGSFQADRRRLEATLGLWITTATLLCVIAFSRIAIALSQLEFGRLRVVDANTTLLIAQALLICLYLWMDSDAPRLYRNLALFFVPFVVLMQHRTVWVMLLVAVVLIAVREVRLRNRLVLVLATGAVLSALGALVVYGDRSSGVLEGSATSTDTFAWRVEGWRVLLAQQFHDPVNVIGGRPFGAGYERYLPSLGYSVDVAPHNYYVEVLLRTGAVGLIVLLTLYGALVQRSLSPPVEPSLRPFQRMALVLLASQLVYFIPYSPAPEQGILLGLALSLALAPAQPRAEAVPDVAGIASDIAPLALLPASRAAPRGLDTSTGHAHGPHLAPPPPRSRS